MKPRGFGVAVIAISLFLGACSQPPSIVETPPAEGTERTAEGKRPIEVGGVEIGRHDSERIGTDFKLLTTPGQFGCGDNFYASSDSRLYYFQLGEFSGPNWFIFNDPKNLPFPSASGFSNVGGCYFRNADHAIYEGAEIKEADLKTFKPLGEGEYPEEAYATDKNRVYHQGKAVPGDAGTYQVLDRDYARDQNSVYHQTEIIEDADPLTFKVLGEGYSKDKNNVYFNSYWKGGVNGAISEADPESIKVLGYPYLAKDKKAVYFQGRKTEVGDAPSFEIVSGLEHLVFYSKDRNLVYFNLVASEADPKTFEVLPKDYSRDRKRVFYRGKEILDADPASHKIVDYLYSKDKKHCFFMGRKITGCDPKTFQGLAGGFYAKDATNAFFEDKKIEGADAGTFASIEGDSMRARDKKFRYYQEKVDIPAMP